MFVSCFSNYIVISFQNKPDTHWFGSRPLYIFTNPTSPYEEILSKTVSFPLQRSHSGKKKHTPTNTDTEIQKQHKRVKWGAQRPREWLLLLVACVRREYTLVHRIISFLNMLLDFFICFGFAVTKYKGQSWNPCSPPETCLFTSPVFSTQRYVVWNLVAQLP